MPTALAQAAIENISNTMRTLLILTLLSTLSAAQPAPMLGEWSLLLPMLLGLGVAAAQRRLHRLP